MEGVLEAVVADLWTALLWAAAGGGELVRGVVELGSSVIGRSVAVLRRPLADRWLGGREISGEGRRLGVMEELGRRCDGLCSLTSCC